MPSYPTYNVLVRLSDTVGQEVYKERVTAAEVVLLQKLHGPDAVCRATRAEPIELELGDVELRLQLSLFYGEEVIQSTFGSGGFDSLPKVVPGFDRVLNLSKPANVDVEALKAQIRQEIMAELTGPAQPLKAGQLFGKGGDKSLLEMDEEDAAMDAALDAPDKPGSAMGGAKVV